MRKIFYLVVLIFVVTFGATYADNFNLIQETKAVESSKTIASHTNEEFDWEPVINAIIQVESKGNTNAISKDQKCVGVLQIQKIVVDDCNEYLTNVLKSKQRFNYDDRYDKDKSIEMFILIQKRYNKSNNIEKAIRLWNGGCGYSIPKTQNYYEKVMKCYKAQD